jgi:hypothetical protein
MMRLPRWMLVVATTLIVFVPLLLAGWWWTNWPLQTAIDFAECLAEGDNESVVKLMPQADWMTALTAFQDVYKGSKDVSFLPRKGSDQVCGRARFRVEGIDAHFLAERGRVRITDRYRFDAILKKQSAVLVHIPKHLEVLAKERAAFLKDAKLGPLPKTELDRMLAERDRQVARFEGLRAKFELELLGLIREDDNSR